MKSVRVSLALFLLALCFAPHGASGGAQPPSGPQEKEQSPVTFEQLVKVVREIDQRMRTVRERGGKLAEWETLRALEVEYAAKGQAAQMAIATHLLTLAPELGNYREALRYGDMGRDKPPAQATALDTLKGYQPVAALEAIPRAAEAAQVVMINEAHHVPQHRAFTIELLKALRRAGFTHFAAETLYEADARLNERGYPVKETGYYTAEPVYGELIRTALRLGYRVIAYEPPGVTKPDERERGQARNLVERILKDSPQARVLVHAGYSHIDESGAQVGALTMAQRFKEMTGINPLTFDQTAMTEHSAPEYEQPLYRDVVERGLVAQPVVFRNAKSELWTFEKGKHDVTVFSPRSRYANGRPDWLRLGGERKPYKLPKNICQAAARCLVRARAASESADAVPVDQMEVIAGRDLPSLMLPAGAFVLEANDEANKMLKTRRIKVR